jgi:hypothetical protein
MKKSTILMALVPIIILAAVTIKLPETGITGFFVKVGVTGFALMKEIAKTVLEFILKLLV